MEFVLLVMGVAGGALIGWALALQGWRDVTPTRERMERAGLAGEAVHCADCEVDKSHPILLRSLTE